MNKINIKELGEGYIIFGNKGNVWNNTAHAYKFNVGNICGTPALSTNWAKHEGIEEVGCEDCLKKLADS